MHPPVRHLALAALLLPALPRFAVAQANPSSPPSPATAVPAPHSTLNHALVFLDPAHGGDDTGAHLRDQLLEKDVTLALANRLRFQLSALGLNVLDTREPDTGAPTTTPSTAPAVPTPDQRAGMANHVHPFACILLHATEAGSGVHLITSAVAESPAESPFTAFATTPLVPWSSAQAASLPQSRRLAAELSSALARAGLPVHSSRASIRPLDNVTCPAVLIELAPLNPSTSPADPAYQARVAQAVATALLFWRGHAEPDLLPAAGADPQP